MNKLLLAVSVSLLLGSTAFADVTTAPTPTTATSTLSVTGYSHAFAEALGNLTGVQTHDTLNLTGSLSGSGNFITGQSTGIADVLGAGPTHSIAESGIIGSLSLSLDPHFISGTGSSEQYGVLSSLGTGSSIVSGSLSLSGNLGSNFGSASALDGATSTQFTSGLLSAQGLSSGDLWIKTALTPAIIPDPGTGGQR